MTFHRREVLASLGVASAAALLGVFGCGSHPPPVRRAPQVSRDVRSWLHDAVARLAAGHPGSTVHALAVSRRRTTCALDVLGPGATQLRGDGAVLTIRRPDGSAREHVTSDLTAAGLDAAVQALGGAPRPATIDFGPVPTTPDEPPALDDLDLRRRVERLLEPDAHLSSRIVYAAAVLDIDDAIVWSVAPGRDLEQRLVRIRQSVTRAAWNGSRPVVATAERAWSGWLDDQALAPADILAASDAALKLMTPGSFGDGERTLLLDPSVAALLVDTLVRHRLTAGPGHTADSASRFSDGASRASPSDGDTRRPANGVQSTSPADHAAARPSGSGTARGSGDSTQLASSAITLIDDPNAAGAYGRFSFDDEGEPAAPLTLLDAGRIAARLADRAAGGSGRGRRPGHLGPIEPASTHLQLLSGSAAASELYSDGLILEGGLAATYDPASDRLRLACARARELRAGNATGRIYADVELVGSLTALLTSIDAVARDPVSIALADPAPSSAADADPAPVGPSHWRSISVPTLRTRGFVRARWTRS